MDRVELTHLAASYMGLKGKTPIYPSTKSMLVHCPVHGKDNKPSMGIDFQKGICHCFACGYSGSIENLFRTVTGQDLYKTLDIKNDPFSTFAARPATTYVNYEDETKLKNVYVSYDSSKLEEIDASWDSVNYLNNRGIPLSVAKSMNFKYADEIRINNTLFKKRIIIPIRENGSLISMEGRDVTGNQTPKVLYAKNCTVNSLYDIDNLNKDETLFGCEGLMDLAVLRACRGFKNSTAIFGAGITKRQLWLISQFKRFVYIPDADTAGEKTVQALKDSGLTNISILRLPKNLYGIDIKDIGDIPKVINPWGRRASVQDLVNTKWLKRIASI